MTGRNLCQIDLIAAEKPRTRMQLSIAKSKLSNSYSLKPKGKKFAVWVSQVNAFCTWVEHTEHHCTNVIRFHPSSFKSVKTEPIKLKHRTRSLFCKIIWKNLVYSLPWLSPRQEWDAIITGMKSYQMPISHTLLVMLQPWQDHNNVLSCWQTPGDEAVPGNLRRLCSPTHAGLSGRKHWNPAPSIDLTQGYTYCCCHWNLH